MKNTSLILSFLLPFLVFCQNENELTALELVEQVAEKTKTQEGNVENFHITAEAKTTIQNVDIDFEVVKHALLDHQELDELNTEIKVLLHQGSQNPYTEEEKYAFLVKGNKFELESYSQNNLVGKNYDQAIARIYTKSLEGELFNRYFLGIRVDKENDFKYGINKRMDKLDLACFLDDYLGYISYLDYGTHIRKPKHLKKTKRYTYQYDEDANLGDGLVKVNFEAVKEKATYNQGFFIIDKTSMSFVEVYLEEQHDEILGCSISSTQIVYEKQNEALYLPQKINFHTCRNCNYYKRKYKLKRVKPEPKKSLKFKIKGHLDRKREMEILIDYKIAERS